MMERVGDVDRESRTERPVGLRAPTPPPHDVLALQRTAGNAAVSRTLAQPGGRTRLLRYGTGEHAQLGGSRTVQLHGQTVTEGELLTMGDFYATPDDMRADSKGFPQLLALVRRDKRFRDGVPGAAKVSDKEWDDATEHMPAGKGYADLAIDNDTHFAPAAGGAGKDHRSEWWKHYSRAVQVTIDHARRGGKGVPEEALTLAGFAGHFLTDAFAAGHIVGKQDIKDFAAARAEELGADETWIDWPFPESSFTANVAERLLNDPKSGPMLHKHMIRIVEWDEIDETKLSELIYALQDNEPHLFFGLFALVVHDLLNRSIKPGGPVGPLEVTNGYGKTWVLSGDGTLAQSPETQAIAQEAVEESFRLLTSITVDPEAVELGWMFRRVWDHTPHPTAKGRQTLKQTLQTYADPARKETQDAVAETLIDQVELIIAKLLERNRLMPKDEYQRQQEKARKEMGPLRGPGRV